MTSLIGQPVRAIETPAMVVDAEKLERNLAKMAAYFKARHAKARPHFKSHKCVQLARRQLAAGSACGITCAKLSEAEQLVAGGVRDILIANQVVGDGKARRLAALNREATVRAAVDSAENVRQLAAAARAEKVTLGLLVEVDVGMGRCGVAPGQATLDLARLVAAADGLRFDGLQGYEGHVVTTPDYEERKRKTAAALAPLLDCRPFLAAAGLPVKIVSSGGTGTYDITGDLPGIDEVQVGSYALMDNAYRKVRPEFEVARTVQARIISATPTHAVADVGAKGLGGEFGLPVIDGYPDAKVRYVAEEHTVIDQVALRVGDLVRIVPSHGCTTNNLYRRMWIARQDRVEAVWEIEASGCLE